MLASNQEDMIETLRKTVKSLGDKVSYTRLTPEEKARIADIVYTYKRQGVKTSENEINRIAINFLVEDYHAHGEDSVLAKVIDALNA
jgi:phage gp16-like protein